MAETATLTLTDFLLARIAEDEAGDAGGHDYWCSWMQASEACDCPRKRMNAECEAKRQIMEKHEVWGPGRGSCDTCTDGDFVGLVDEGPCFTLRALAAVYADHPDYREEWRVNG